MDNLQRHQLIVPLADLADEEERRISPINNLRVCARPPRLPSESFGVLGSYCDGSGKRTLVFEEVTHACPARQNKLRNVLDDLRLLLLGHRGVPFRETDFPCGCFRIVRSLGR